MTFVVVNGIVTEGPGSQSGAETTRQPELVIGLLASPGPASELTGSLAGEVIDRLAGQLPGVRWRVKFVSDRLVESPTDLSALIAAGRRMLLERGWHLVVCVTDLPLQTARPTGWRSCRCRRSARSRCASGPPRRSSAWSGTCSATWRRPRTPLRRRRP